MFLRKTVLFCLLFIGYIFVVTGQEKALDKIDVKDLKKHLEFIASDDLQGRKLGTPVDGLEITANYLAKCAKEIGLKPGPQGYFQEVPMTKIIPGKYEIEVLNKKGKVSYKSDELVLMNQTCGSQTCKDGDVVLVGFGENITEMDLAGKIVVVSQGNAESFKKEGPSRWDFGLERTKMAQLSKKEPKAIIFVTDTHDKENKGLLQMKARFNSESYSLRRETESKEKPMLLASPAFADALLGKKGSFKNYLQKEIQNKENTPYEISDKKINYDLGISTEPITGKNVIGVVEGSDPVLKNEYVVFVAHFDHLGIGKDGDVYNGADDNGSGTVAILEAAEAFASLDVKPKRSIVFLWVTCEEIGHFGSRYYCDHPLYPLENTVAAINLDMVGRVYDGPRDDVWKDSPKKVKDFDGLYTLANDVWPELAKLNSAKCKELGLVPDYSLPKERFMTASDHYYFHTHGVPILNYATGYHADYHKVGDEVDKINFDKIKRVADLCFLLGNEVGNLENIKFERK